jgi:hypothetical protein
MHNLYYFDITFSGSKNTILKILEYIQPMYKKELNYEECNIIFNKDYEYIKKFNNTFNISYFNHIDEEDILIIVGHASELNTAIEFTSMISKIFNIKLNFHYENQIQNVAADQEYNEEGICTFDEKSTYWKYKFIQGDFFHEFDIVGENIHTHEQLSDFLLENDIEVEDEFDMEVMIGQTKIK